MVDARGAAVSLTTTVNLFFGAVVQSAATGLLWNDQMDDFSQPGRSNAFVSSARVVLCFVPCF